MKNKKVVMVALLALVAAVPAREVVAGPDPGVISGDTATFSGDQSAGIRSGVDFLTPPITTLDVDSLSGPIDPAAGTPGIYFLNTQGAGITIEGGDALENLVIDTEGADAVGIWAVSEGAPASYEWNPALGIQAPSGPSGSGGPVAVTSYSDITTDGGNAHGIVAQNRIGIYNPASTATLQAFSTDDVDLSLTSVAGSAGNIGAAVAGDNGGLFTLHGDGTWDFDASDLNGVLAVGETAVTKIVYEVGIVHDPADFPYGSQSSGGSFAMHVTKTDDGVFEAVPAIYFEEFDQFSDPAATTPLWPDLQGYVDALLADMGIAGAGESLSVTSEGAITTHGTSSHGILAQTEGGRGSAGSSGTFWNANQLPTDGGRASNGGAVTVVSNGDVVTHEEFSVGIAVESHGGTGGKGGNGGPWRNGAQGGTGGNGGEVLVQGSGRIETFEDYASGIIAMSAGGAGGAGGSGAGVTDAGNGGFGGKGGNVGVEGSWDVTTRGNKAHGIWAKSAGGSAGAGGSGGWLFGSPGSGGEASDGGRVVVDSSGVIQTAGEDAYGIYAESVGGFGGSGGSTFGLFWAFGGDGGSAGSGGDVEVTNRAGGDITTHGTRSHAMFAQSVGGGGGSGGGEFGLFYSLGGDGEAGGTGGSVEVFNAASLRTYGSTAKGIYAQSVGGGGGDGDWSAGLVAIGGSGSEASDGGAVSVDNSGTISTDTDRAEAIFAQSIGGGGGNAGTPYSLVRIGSPGGGGGNAGNVLVENSGDLQTAGPFSRAIVAQSVGYGGGNGTSSGSPGTVYVGSSGGGSGDGGTVDVTNSGAVTTSHEDSTAIFAQSIGGGGGSLSGSDAVIVSIGGDAGSSGDGSSVIVNNSGTLITTADRSGGIFAESVGAGGGSGTGSDALIYSLGGDAGSSGNGGTVDATNSGRIETSGTASDAILAQSVGGGGGNGGGGGSGSLVRAYGGAGGSAGDGANVDATNSGEISTSGDDSRGIVAQSLGGGGGIAQSSEAAFVSLGGDGGSSGGGGEIVVDNMGSITTRGNNSDAIFAQSVGGGGGSAGTTESLYMSLGGKGASGGDGGAVEITTSNQIVTHGMNSNGVLAQSIGGGGGSASDASVTSLGIGIEMGSSAGGDGGDGGDGAGVTIVSDSDIRTHGHNSKGIIAQSIGGGGGNAGSGKILSVFGFAPDIFDLFNMSISLLLSGGGNGGTTGDGAIVDVESSGRIDTSGFHSQGILAQSVGGGGGNGGSARIFSGAFNADNEIILAIGGDGTAGGDGRAVDVRNHGVIETTGHHSSGVLAQSVGGGGGSGGDARVVHLNLDLYIPTSPNDILDLAQTVSFTGSVGGSGGAAGVGGTVNVDNDETVITQGAFSSGILAQSIGGGGGAGGGASVYEIELGDPISTFTSLFMEIEYDFIIGGNAGGGGNAGNVTVTNSGDILTSGAFAPGILAQSIGGGGGAGGNVVKFEFNGVEAIKEVVDELFDLGDSSFVLSGSGGSGGNGANTTVTNSSNITTDGDFAYGILAQSIGGGGGLAGISENLDLSSLILGSGATGSSSRIAGSGVAFAGSLGFGSSSAGNVMVSQTGDITTRGVAAHGIFAQSATGANSLGTSGTVTVTLDGDIDASGSGSHGIFAQSVWDWQSLNHIWVEVLDGAIRGGDGAGAGVRIDGGAYNTLTNAGDISASSGTAIIGGSGHETIQNSGVITGDVNLGAGTNAFRNLAEGVFNSGSAIDLGAGRPLTNYGTLSPGGSGTVLTTALMGTVHQTDSGVFAVDLDLATEEADRFNVSGASNLDGLVEVNVLNQELVKPGTIQKTIVSSAGGVTDSGLAVESFAVVDYELLFLGSTNVDLEMTVDFSPSGRGLTANQRAIGAAINAIQLAGGSPSLMPYVLEIFNLPDTESLADAYDHLSPESYDASTMATFAPMGQYTQTLLKRMHSIRRYLDVAGRSPGASQTLKNAAWIDGFGQWGNQDADNGFTGFEYGLGGLGLGVDHLFRDVGILAGLSFGYANTNIDLDDNRGDGEIDSYFGSLYGSWFGERGYVDAAFSYGRQSYENTRRIEVGDLTEVARSDHDGDLFSLYGEAGWNFDLDGWLIRPFGALQYLNLHEEGHAETGADGVNLVIDDRRTDGLVSDLGLRFGRAFDRGEWLFLPQAVVAWRHDFDLDHRLTTAAFEGAPGVSFTTEGRDVDRNGVILGADLTLLKKSGLSMQVKYNFEMRGDYTAHQPMLGFRYEF